MIIRTKTASAVSLPQFCCPIRFPAWPAKIEPLLTAISEHLASFHYFWRFKTSNLCVGLDPISFSASKSSHFGKFCSGPYFCLQYLADLPPLRFTPRFLFLKIYRAQYLIEGDTRAWLIFLPIFSPPNFSLPQFIYLMLIFLCWEE